MIYLYWLGLVAVPVIVAQNSSSVANCTDSRYHWTFNSLGQSPCNVADLLENQCTGKMYGIPPLTIPRGGYNPLLPYYATFPCFCNTVWYSLLSACVACQDGTWLSWPAYSQVCDQTYLMLYPDPIPPGTSVPGWAYLNVTATNNTFNLAAASHVTTSTPASFISTLASTFASTSTPASTSTSSTPASTSGLSTSDASKTGVMPGSTVGCLVIGLLVATFLLCSH